jgi:hypothetical protein
MFDSVFSVGVEGGISVVNETESLHNELSFDSTDLEVCEEELDEIEAIDGLLSFGVGGAACVNDLSIDFKSSDFTLFAVLDDVLVFRSLSFLVGTISNVLVMEIGWTDVGSGGYILVSCAHSNASN